LTVLFNREPARRALKRVLEAELELVLDVAALPGAARAARPPAAARILALARPSEEGVEEIGERIGVAEHLAHLFRAHRAEAAAARRAAEIDVPRVAALEPAARRAAGLLVHAPVGPELVVFFSLLRIAEHLVRLVHLLELRLGC